MTKPCWATPGLFSLSCAILLSAPVAMADNILVTSTADDMSGGTLREAIAQADGTPGDDVITFSATGSIDLVSVLVVDNSGMGKTLIDATSVGEVTIVGSGTERVFEIGVDAEVELVSLFITGGQAPEGMGGVAGESPTAGASGGDGGGILNFGDLTLRSCIVNFNSAGNGGAGGSYAGMATGDGAGGGSGGRGGGIFTSGDNAVLSLVGSTVDVNFAGSGGTGGDGENGGNGGDGGSGGGIYCEQGALVISTSLIDGNDSGSGGAGGIPEATGTGGNGGDGGPGGGISVELGSLSLADSVVSVNSAGNGGIGGRNNGVSSEQPGPGGAGGNGGGVHGSFFVEGPDVEIDSSLINQNSAGRGANGADNPGGTAGDGGYGGLGGGIYVETFPASSAVWDVVNSTIYQNSAGDSGSGGLGSTDGHAGIPGGGGGFAFVNGSGAGGMTVVHSVVSSNSAGENPDTFALGAGSAGSGDVGLVLGNSVVVFNFGPMGDDIDIFTEEGQNFIGGDPQFGPLQDNGGSTLTFRPIFGSPLIDGGGTITNPPSVDARNSARPGNAAPDIGSVEVVIQPDIRIGAKSDPATQKIDNYYSPSGAGQVENVKLKGKKKKTFYFTVESDGDILSPFFLTGTPASKRMKFKVQDVSAGGANVTASIKTGYALGEFEPGKLQQYKCTAKSKSHKTGKKVNETLIFQASIPGTSLRDSAISVVKGKKEKK